MPQIAQNLSELYDRPAGVNFQAKHFAQHRNSDLKSDSSKKTHQHGLREEVGYKTELEYSRH